MSKYKINYFGLNGQPISVTRDDGAIVPIDKKNNDFRDFLEWNAKQKNPLDWKTPIEPLKQEQQPDPLTQLRARVSELEAKIEAKE